MVTGTCGPFGAPGAGYVRINLGSPRETLAAGVQRMLDALAAVRAS